MIRDDLGDVAQEYAQWLQNTQRCKFSTIANYINGLVSITSYCYTNLAPNDALLAMDPSPLTQLINLRGQAEKASKTQQMYDKRVGGWLEWPDVQKAQQTREQQRAASVALRRAAPATVQLAQPHAPCPPVVASASLHVLVEHGQSGRVCQPPSVMVRLPALSAQLRARPSISLRLRTSFPSRPT